MVSSAGQIDGTKSAAFHMAACRAVSMQWIQQCYVLPCRQMLLVVSSVIFNK